MLPILNEQQKRQYLAAEAFRSFSRISPQINADFR
jgi:hypothetical protein